MDYSTVNVQLVIAICETNYSQNILEMVEIIADLVTLLPDSDIKL